MVNYQLGKIYKIVNQVDDLIYIGSTCEPRLCRRFSDHKLKAKKGNRLLHQHMNRIGIDHFHIELIESYPCNSKDELHSREQYYINLIGAGLNHIKSYTGMNDIEYQKLYYQDNKDSIAEYKKEQYQKNKDKLSSKYLCECGKSFRYSDIPRHLKTKNHQLYIMFGGLNTIAI